MDGLKKMTLVFAALCVLIGTITATTAFKMMGYKPKSLETVHAETTKFETDGDFKSIKIDEINCDVQFFQTGGDNCDVLCTENEHLKFEVKTEGGVLYITQKDESRWYDKFGVDLEDEYILHVFLPKTQFNSVEIGTVSGDIELTDEFTVKSLKAVTVSGDLTVNSSVTDSAVISTVSGNAAMTKSLLESFDFTTVSGDVKLTEITVLGNMSMESTSGDFELNRCDAESIDINTVSGDVKAQLLTEKEFIIDTNSGTVNVPESADGAGGCRIETVSGDINVTVTLD